MNSKVIRMTSTWLSCTVLLAVLGYSAAVLIAQPAYADTVCEPEDCAIITQTIAPAFCSGHGGVEFVECPVNSTFPDNYDIQCNELGRHIGGNCSNF